ncbi:unnamed protein product, partial [marine sediment metagenome]
CSLALDEGEGTIVKDSSGNNSEGEVHGEATWTEGKSGKALSLKGAKSKNYIEIPDQESLQLTGKFTIEFWWKKVSGGVQIFFRKGESGNNYNYYAWLEKKIYFSVSDRDEKAYAVSVPSPGNGWHQLTFVYDGQELKIYIDKELAGSKKIGKITLFTDESPLYIGTHNPDYSHSLAGTLDEFRILDEALTLEKPKAEVTNIQVSDIIAHWHFDEGEGSVVKDSSGNNNHGKVSGTNWVRGKKGFALQFPGKGNYISIPNSPSLQIKGPFTIDFWLSIGTKDFCFSLNCKGNRFIS